MKRKRRGFSIVELVVVIVIIGVLSIIAFPQFNQFLTSVSVKSANQQVAAYLVRARAAAIENGRVARFIRTGNTVLVTVDRPGGPVVIGAAQDLYASHGVTLSATRDTIAYDPRGFAVGLGGRQKVNVYRGTLRDSVCVAGLGKITPSACTL
ncbi:MAG: prepilin-type N-terminal cleavage/methylation domain-containing protein [Gemmatimonadaceae bacterium]